MNVRGKKKTHTNRCPLFVSSLRIGSPVLPFTETPTMERWQQLGYESFAAYEKEKGKQRAKASYERKKAAAAAAASAAAAARWQQQRQRKKQRRQLS